MTGRAGHAPTGREPARAAPRPAGLRITADDLGLSEAINEGIAAAAREGLVDAVSALAAGPALAHGLDLLAGRADIAVGLHLDLADLPALAPHRPSSTLSTRGRFRRRTRALLAACALGAVARRDLEAELEAQLARLAAAGVRPTHLDGHRHVHLFPGLAPIVRAAVDRHRLAHVRLVPWRSPAAIAGAHVPERLALATLSRALGRALVGSGATTPTTLLGLADGHALDPARLALAHRAAERAREPRDGGAHLVEVVVHPGAGDATVGRDLRARLRDLEALRAAATATTT